MASLEASPHYIIYFDNVRVDEFVKSWTVNLSCNGNIGTAEIEFIYLADLAYTAASVEDITNSKSIMKMLGIIDNMTNVKIFVKNVFSQKYQIVFDGNIKGKSSSRSPRGSSLVFRATDYMAWTNRTVAPIVIPYTQSTHPSDKFIWEAQGIDVSKVMDVAQRDIIGFKGKRLEEIINTVVTQAIAANKIYSSRQGVAYWDGIWDRMDLMADIDPDILNKNVLDYIISPNQGSVDTMYVLLNDIFSKLMFEFYQDRDGVIRIKPPFWNEPVLKSHIIDPALMLNQSETSDYDKYISRVVITGGLDENFQSAGDYATKLWTPTGAYLSDGTWETVKKSDKWVNGWLGGGDGGDGSGGGTSAPGGVNTRQITKNGFRFIKGQEGFIPTGNYFNKEKWRTTGYGCTEKWNKSWYDRHKPFPTSERQASELMVDRLYAEEVKHLVNSMKKAGIDGKIKDHQLDAMVSVGMNHGVYGFTSSGEPHSPWHIIKKNPENYSAIRTAWEKYATSGHDSVRERRKGEADMYCEGSYKLNPILKYNNSGSGSSGYVTENNGHGHMPSSLKGTVGGRARAFAEDSREGNLPFAEFNLEDKRKGNIYKRKDGSPIVGIGDDALHKDVQGDGVWWPSVESGIKGHVQHLSSYFRDSLVSNNECIDPKFGDNKKTADTVKHFGNEWSSTNERYSSSLMYLINKMLGTNLKDTEIGALSKAQYDLNVTSDKKKKIKNYFIKVTQGKTITLTANVTREYFIEQYFAECEKELIYPEVAIAQMCQETGNFSFKGGVVYNQNNFGGIGATGNNYTKASDWYWVYNAPRSVAYTTNSDAVSATQYSALDDTNAFLNNESDISTFSREGRASVKPRYVIVDAGHGGDDEGIVGGKSSDKYYIKEKDIAFWLQNRIVDILKHNKISASHSRTNDRNIGSGSNYKQRTKKMLEDIKKRGHKPEQYLVVSIHSGSGKSSIRGFGTITHKTEAKNNSKNLAKQIRKGISDYNLHHWETSGCKNPQRPNKTSTLSSLSERNFPGGSVVVEAIHLTSLEDRKLWKDNPFTYRDAVAVGIASGIIAQLGKTMNGIPTLEIEDTNETNPDLDSTATGGSSANGWNGSSFKEDLDWDDVDFSALLKPTHEEMRYGGSIRQIEQPLIKFSNSGAYYDMQGDHNADANEVLKSYAKFYMNMNNSLINTSSITLIGAPWIRPGFNVWIDPAYTDKVYYVNGITHSGSAGAGVTTSLQLVHGRHREDFVKDGDSRGFGALSKNDDSIFTKNEYFKSVKNFGPVLETSKAYKTEKTNLINIMKNCNNQGIIKAERSPYAPYYASDYGDSFLKSPTILKVNDAGKEIFTDEEWKEITGRSVVIDTALEKKEDEKEEVKKDENKDDEKADKSINKGKTFINQSRTAVTINKTDNKTTNKTDNKTTNKTDNKTEKKRTFVNNGVLKKGKKGAKIKELQKYMNEFMDRKIITGKKKLSIDGSFGPLTDAVVRAYQKSRKIVVDGMVGPITTGKINKDLNSSTNGNDSNTGNDNTNTNPGVNNTKPENNNPKDEKSAAKGRVSNLLFTDQYSAKQIQDSLDNMYKDYAPGVVKQRMHVIEQGVIAARKTSEKSYINNNYNK